MLACIDCHFNHLSTIKYCIIGIYTCRTTHGKGNEQFMQSLIELLRVTCNMMAKECPEGELVAPKAVSILYIQ